MGKWAMRCQGSTANLFQVSGVNLVGQGHELFIPTRLAGFVASDQQDRGTPGIEGKENPIGPSLVLTAKFTHIRKPGTPVDRIGVRPLEMNALLFQKADRKVHAFLLIGGKAVPPLLEFLGELDLVGHEYYIPIKLYIPSRLFLRAGSQKAEEDRIPGLRGEAWSIRQAKKRPFLVKTMPFGAKTAPFWL